MLGFVILTVAFIAALCISWKSTEAVKPNVADTPAPATSDGVSGFPKAVDALAQLERARDLTARRELRRILLTGVRSDGTLDLTQSRSGARFEFASARGEGPEPPRPVGTAPRGQYCGRQIVHLTAKGMFADPDLPRAACARQKGDPLPPPQCSAAQIWAQALQRGVDVRQTAAIEYYRARGGPAWRFTAVGSPLSFALYGDCEKELSSEAARRL